jgi:hypothetical protein
MIQEIRRAFFLGLDLGQTHDPSAMSVIEQEEVFQVLGSPVAPGGVPSYVKFVERTYIIRRLDRFPLRTSYTDIVKEVATAFISPALRVPVHLREEKGGQEIQTKYSRNIPEPSLVIDSTGLGAPVRDMMVAAKLNPIPILITRGESAHPVVGAGVGVPKRDLAQNLIVLFETGRLKITSNLKLLTVFLKELSNFRGTITASGRDVYEAASGHDDLVLATALPLWYAEMKAKEPPPPQPLPRKFAAGFYTR